MDPTDGSPPAAASGETVTRWVPTTQVCPSMAWIRSCVCHSVEAGREQAPNRASAASTPRGSRGGSSRDAIGALLGHPDRDLRRAMAVDGQTRLWLLVHHEADVASFHGAGQD